MRIECREGSDFGPSSRYNTSPSVDGPKNRENLTCTGVPESQSSVTEVAAPMSPASKQVLSAMVHVFTFSRTTLVDKDISTKGH